MSNTTHRLTVRPTAVEQPSRALSAGLAVGLLMVGFASAGIGGSLSSRSIADTANDPTTSITVPQWIFWAVWLVIYPALGVAASILWTARRTDAGFGALLLLLVNMVFNLAVVPVAVLGDDVRIIAILDLVGLVAACSLAFACRRVSATAFRWTTPYLVWMPITVSLKWVLVALTWQ